MALTFPSSPSNGQLYTDTVTGYRYIYNATAGVWSFAANNVGMSVSSTPPSNVAPGAMWFNREIGRTFVYYDDGDSKQWIETVPAGAVDTNVVAGYVNPVFASMNGAYTTANAGFGVANSGFAKANNALANTSGVSTAGSLTIAGSLTAANTAAGTTTGIILDNGSITSLPNVKISWASSGAVKSSIIANVYGQDYMAFNVNNDTERMRIDAQGRILTPYQPAFRAQKTTNTTSTGEIVFNSALVNRGSHFNTSTGRFTAPVSGAYFFTFTGVPYNTSALNAIFLVNGGAAGLWVYQGNLSSDLSASFSGVLQLSAGDYVSVSLVGGTLRQSNGDNNNFSGFLLG